MPLNPLTLARRVRQRTRDWWRGETAATYFDVYDRNERLGLGIADIEPPRLTVGERHPDANVARCVWDLRPDLRAAFPLGLTPAMRRNYAAWLLEYGPTDFGLTPQAVVAYLAELAADPSHGLAASYLTRPDWQRAVPHALDHDDGWEALKRWLAGTFAVHGTWLRRAKRATVETPKGPGINLLTHFRYPSGLREEAVQLGSSMERVGFRVARRDLPAGFPCDCDDPLDYRDPERFPVSLLKIGACEFVDEQYRKAGLHPRDGVYRIAGWSWELEDFPAEPIAHAPIINEVWTPSDFCTAAVRRVVTDRPVLTMRPGIATPVPSSLRRADFGLGADDFVFAFFFDMGSVMERKNPLGLIRAFRRAFRPDEPAKLVIKVSRGQSRPVEMAKLARAAADAGVVVIDRIMPRADSFALMATCDGYVSLHRAEGFGLSVAEAMLLGKPVISTDYSATTEFLTTDTGLPVRYRTVEVGPGRELYAATSRWAEPDEAHASERMRWVYENRDAARQLGERAKVHAEAVLSPVATGERIAARVREILNRPARDGA